MNKKNAVFAAILSHKKVMNILAFHPLPRKLYQPYQYAFFLHLYHTAAYLNHDAYC